MAKPLATVVVSVAPALILPQRQRYNFIVRGCISFRGWAGWTIVWYLAMTLGAPILAQDHPQQRVLVLFTTPPGGAATRMFEAAYRRILGKALGTRLDFHTEFIDLARFGSPDFQSVLRQFLRDKYRPLQPDVVLVTTEAARQFVEQSRANLFTGIPVVYIGRETPSRPATGMTGVNVHLDLAGTLDLALTLQPNTKNVVIVSGVSEFDRIYEKAAREQLKRFAGRVSLNYLSELSLSDLTQTLAHLPPDSIIYFLTLGEDGAGAKFLSTDALDQLAAAANVPIYAWGEVMLGHGVIGGRLYSEEIVAERSAALALRILGGENVDTIPAVAVDPFVAQIDWRQLQRWSISEARVPSTTVMRFRAPSFWGLYKGYIASAIALMLIQSALIGGLLLQRARRRRTESELRENQATLEASHKQISDLFGRLIAAQEAERTRIARELHDGVSQAIAGLSIAISSLKRRLNRDPDSDVMQELSSMQQRALSLADEIRDVSHDLHPSVLQHAGLVAALLAFCDQFGKHHELTVNYAVDDNIGSIEAETALCLYRIAQEVLRNIAKHADARQIDVALTRTSHGVQMSIADDGKGFNLARTRAKVEGLGLVSIDERARLLRGSVHIDTHPRSGTRVDVLIPRNHELRVSGLPGAASALQ